MKNLTKQLLLATCLTSTLGSASFAAEEEVSPISANVTIASDYVWRGKTQTDDKKAIQGGLDYDAGNGFALGIWGSNVDFGGLSSEFDIYGSYSGELEGGFGYEVGYISYTYNKKSGNFKESYISGSYGDFGLTYYKGAGSANNYVEGSYGTNVNDIDVSLTFGKYSDTAGTTDGYKMYGLSLGKSYAGLDYALGFTKTNENTAGASNEKNTVLSISKSF